MAEPADTVAAPGAGNERIRRLLGRVTPAASVLVVAVACAVLAAWALEVVPILRGLPVTAAGAMTPNTAVGLLLCGVSLWLLRKESWAASGRRTAGRILAGAAALLGLLTLTEYSAGIDLGIDRLLFPETIERLEPGLPGRPAPNTALSLVLIGAALLLLDVETRRGGRPAQVLALLPGLLAIQALAGYGYRQEELFAPGPGAVIAALTAMAALTAASFLALSLGVLFARPERGIAALLTGRDAGAFVARRLLPAAILLPLLLGWLRLAGERAGLYGPEVGTSLYAAAVIVAFTLAIGWNAAALRRLDLERSRAEAARRESEGRFRAIFEQAGIGIALTDAGGRIVTTNTALRRFLGYTAGELEGLHFTQVTHPDDVGLDSGLFRELLEGTRDSYQIEKRYIRKAGEAVWGRLTGSLVRGAAGRAAYGVGVVEDITARKRIEEERGRLTAILEATPDFVGTADGEGRALTVNRGGREMVGIERGEDVRRLRIPDFHPAWAAAIVLREGIPAAARDGVWTGETALLTRSGREIPVSQVIIAHRGPGGRVQYFSTVMRDISDRKRREEHERFLLEASRALSRSLDEEEILEALASLIVPARADYCVIDRVDPDGTARRRITAHRDPAGRDALEELRRFPPGPGRRPGLARALRSGRPVRVADVTDDWLATVATSPAHLALLRRLAPRSLIIVPLVVHDRVIGAITLARTAASQPYGPEDLALATELAGRAALAVENCRLYRESRTATRIRDEVLRVVAHDLRNPLNTIGLSAGLVLELLPEDLTRERQQLQVVRRSVDRSNRLIEDLLDVARMEAGRLAVERAPVETAPLVREAVDLHVALAAEKQIRLDADVPGDLPPIDADRDRMLQVFSNLIGNAIKYTPEGGRVSVRAERAGTEVRFAVSDTGPGIPEDEQRRLFDPFWQARTERGGAGLGLPIARGIIEAHGGRIGVRSEAGAGSTFTFTVPVAGEAEEEKRAA